MSLLAADRFFSLFDLKAVKTLHCFISIPKFNEVDTSIFFERIWSEFPNVRTAAPRVNRKADRLEHLFYGAQTPLTENSWGIREPAGEEKADPEEIDLVLVPLLCFDERGYRVGYGKGYYDRFLEQCRPDCRKVGLSYFPPADLIADIHDGDVRLDSCVTPAAVYNFKIT